MKQTTNPSFRTRGNDYSKKENQIGCGWCANEKTCNERDSGINKALLGCTEWKHYSETETPAKQSEA